MIDEKNYSKRQLGKIIEDANKQVDDIKKHFKEIERILKLDLEGKNKEIKLLDKQKLGYFNDWKDLNKLWQKRFDWLEKVIEINEVYNHLVLTQKDKINVLNRINEAKNKEFKDETKKI